MIAILPLSLAVYTDHKGRRGYIDDGRQEVYRAGTEWGTIVPKGRVEK